MKPRGKKIDYRKFGINYVAGRKVCHLQVNGKVGAQCGLYRLSLRVTAESRPICKNCVKTVKIIKGLGKRIAVFRTINGVTSIVEMV